MKLATLLLCDDEDVLRRATRQMLELEGLSVVDSATSEGLLREFMARPDAFALVLTDVVLHDLSGPELARRIHAVRPQLPVVFMSGYTRDVVVDARDGVEAAAFLKTPFTVETLMQTIAQALGR